MGMVVNPFRFAPTYAETAIIGNKPASPAAGYSLGVNFKSIIPITVPGGGIWIKTFHIYGQQASAGDKLRPVLYDGIISTSALVKSGEEYVYPSTYNGVTTEHSVNWNSDGSAYFIPAGSYGVGCITSVNGGCRIGGAGSTYWNGDTYSDGATNPFGLVSSSAVLIAAWCPYSVTGP